MWGTVRFRALTAIAGALPQHDANGNLANDGAGQAYSYDPENRLIAASGPRNATLGYDPMGRLAQVSDVATRRMAYDGDALAEEYDGSGTLLRRFIHGPAVDDPVVWYEGATLADRRFLHADHQGSVVAVSDASGNGTINKYDEYGVPAVTNAGRFGYTGQAWVPELDLWYYKARFYSPHAKDGGRFLQVDPVGHDDQLNLYAYVGNDPGNRTDPSGQQLVEKYPSDHQIVSRVNSFATSGRTESISVGKGATLTLTRTSEGVKVTVSQKIDTKLGFKVTAKISGTGKLSVSPGSVKLTNLKLRSETPLVSIRQAPTTVTLRNEQSGRIGVHTDSPIVVKAPLKEIVIPKIDKVVNPPLPE